MVFGVPQLLCGLHTTSHLTHPFWGSTFLGHDYVLRFLRGTLVSSPTLPHVWGGGTLLWAARTTCQRRLTSKAADPAADSQSVRLFWDVFSYTNHRRQYHKLYWKNRQNTPKNTGGFFP